MRKKYIEEDFLPLYPFGGNPETGAVCLSDSFYDTVATVTNEDESERIMERKNGVNRFEFEVKTNKKCPNCGELLVEYDMPRMMDATELNCKKCKKSFLYCWRSQEISEK